MLQNPHVLEESPNSLIIALSDTEIGKIILPPKFTLVDAATGEPMSHLFGDLIGRCPILIVYALSGLLV